MSIPRAEEPRPPTLGHEATPEDTAASDARIRRDLARLLQTRLLRESGLILLGHPLLIVLIAVLLWPDVPPRMTLTWVGAVVLATALRAGWLRWVAHRAPSDRDLRNGVRLTVVALGLCWGIGAAVLLPIVPLPTAALILVVLAGLIATALTTLAADLLSFRGFLAAISLPVLVGLGADTSDRTHSAAVGIVTLYTLAMIVVARRAHLTLVDHLQITARLAVSEEAATRAAAVMRDARDLAERTAQAQSAFLANMSHEIRTPMNAVLGFVELVLDTDLSIEQRRALELVRSSSEALLMILNDILDYSKIEADHLALEAIPFDLPKLVHTTASLLAVRARDKHLELLADVAPDVPRGLRGDPTRLRQVLMNLIGNAIKFTEAGEVVVAVQTCEARPGHTCLRFGVRDTGIGIAPEHLQSIFTEFAQADPTMTRRYGGTGLGLAISQRLVRLMGGTLAVTSAVGHGSEFSFSITLPLAAGTHALPTRRDSLGGRRMLIVDDHDTNRRILREMLAAEGIAVDEAVDAPRGLAALRGAAAAGAPYDLAILDVQMPHMDGFQLAAAVRADAGLAHTQLLMLTSTGQRGDGERCRALGIRAYLTKPLARADLLEALGAVLAEPPAAGSGDVITRHSIAESRVGLRILLVEDNAVNQEVAVAMLVKRGHAVHVADNGQEAVRAVTQRGYDVVLMDIQMPTMDGFQATAAIRALPHGHALPIIGLTAHAVSGERERCLARGMTDYLAKPFKAAELFAVVEERAASPSAIATASPPPPPAPAPPIDLDGFRSTMRDAGAEGAVYAILDTFERQGPERLAAVAAAVRGGDAGAIARAAHVFRGAAATIGARELATLLERVETAARAGNVQEARDALERTHIAARAALDYLRRERQRAHAAEEGER